MNENDNLQSINSTPVTEEYSLNDDRRVKVLSPGAMGAKRFFRNRIAVVGLVILAFMFLFSFVGGLIGNLLGIGGGWITGLLLAIGGACLVIWLYRKFIKK